MRGLVVRSLAILTMAALLLLLAGAAAAQPADVHVPVPEGWTAVDEEYRFGPENLWEYINGAADLFLTYGFQELVVLDMEQGDAALSVSVYDMGRQLDAFGIYESEKPADGDGIDGVGAAAVLQPPYRGLILKDRWYVKVEVGGGDVDAPALEAAMRDIAAGLPGSDDLPAALLALPSKGRKPGTVAYTGSSFLGLDDLEGCLHADYEVDGVGFQLFVMKPSKGLQGNKRGKWAVADGQNGDKVYRREIPYTGTVVLVGDDEQLLGVAGLENGDQALALLASMKDGS